MTIHNAKGLEFPVVFLAGMEEGLFPHSRSIESPTAMEEERRFCYVGMTRAEKRLVLSWAHWRRRFGCGEQERSMPSRFLREVPGQSDAEHRGGRRREYSAGRSHGGAAGRCSRRRARTCITGKTYNSVENVSQFFRERGMNFPSPRPSSAQAGSAAASRPTAPPAGSIAAIEIQHAAAAKVRNHSGSLPKAPPPPKQAARGKVQ